MKKQTKFVVGALIIIVSLGWLAWVGAKESKTYYHTIAELSALKGAEARHRMRVGGTVRAGSIARYTGRVDFVIEREGKSLPEEHTSELQSRQYLVCRLLLEKKKAKIKQNHIE